LTLISQ